MSGSREEPFIIDTTDSYNDEEEVHPCILECAEVCRPFGISLHSDDFLPHSRLNDRIIDAAVACLMHTYILEDPRDCTICMAFPCCFYQELQFFNRRTPIPRSRASLITFTSQVTLPFNDQLQQAPIEKISLVVFPPYC